MRMRVILIFAVVWVLLTEHCRAQCPITDFSMPSTVCIGEVLTLTNTSTGALTETWDFCDGSILNTPTVTLNGSIAKASNPNCISTQIEGNNFYSFVTSRSNNKLLRLEFGSQLTNTPTVVDLGDFGAVLNTPQGIDFFKQGSNYFALITSGAGSVFRLSFGNSITNIPTITTLTSVTGLNDLRQLKIVQDGSNIYAAIAGGGPSGVFTILDFGTSILNAPTVKSTSFAGSFLTGLSVVRDCDQWFVVVEGYSSGVHLLNFGSSLLNTPTISSIGSISVPLNVKIVKSSGIYYGFVPTDSNSDVLRLNFGSSINNTNPTITNLGNYGNLSLAIGYDLIAFGSKYFSLFINFSDNKLTFLDFPKNCSVNNDFKGVMNPQVAYTSAGAYNITLNSYDSQGRTSSKTKVITVSSAVAPDIDFTNINGCSSQSTSFSAVNSSGNIVSFNWNFGDGNLATGANTTNTFIASGLYNVGLSVVASNGCTNFVKDTVRIYNIPQSNFNLPSANPICTNQVYSFINTSTYDGGLVPSWEWTVNGSLLSTAKDLSYSILTATSQAVKLKVVIPGCQNEITQNIATVDQGPLVDFIFSNTCKDSQVNFTNTTTGATSFSWDFGDGNTSINVDGTNTFSNAGIFNVKLQAINVAGCQNSATKAITIYSKPSPDFSLSLPPFSCSGTPSQFNDLTPNPSDSNLASWLWSFDDPTSGQNTSTIRNAKHTYASAGDYNVSLSATTNFGCTASKIKMISVSQSPVMDFTNSPACFNKGTHFTDATAAAQTWLWQIENATYSIANPIHVFAAPGDYTVNLTVTSSNNCIGFLSKVISVPDDLEPDFSFQKNCTNQNTEFVDLTNSVSDPVVSQQWTFGSLGQNNGSPAVFNFNSTGSISTTLEVTAQSGCKYSISKNVDILSGPTVSFTASPESGVPPLDVQFTNNSTNATSYLWAFNDSNSTTSTLQSPSFTFVDKGDHIVDLTAYNNLGCSSTISKLISAISPFFDVSLIGFNIVKNEDGSLKLIASLKNEGNISLSDLTLALNISGITTIREKVETIAPRVAANHVFSYEITDASRINYLCATVVLEDDPSPEGNEKCVTLDTPFFLYEPYPSPVTDNLNVDWISSSTDAVSITIIDAVGQQLIAITQPSDVGLNSKSVSLTTLSDGLYICLIKYGNTKEIKRIAVKH